MGNNDIGWQRRDMANEYVEDADSVYIYIYILRIVIETISTYQTQRTRTDVRTMSTYSEIHVQFAEKSTAEVVKRAAFVSLSTVRNECDTLS